MKSRKIRKWRRKRTRPINQNTPKKQLLMETLEQRVLLNAARFAPLLATDAFEPNDTRLTAADVGVIPGVHLGGLTGTTVADEDWFKLELLRADDLDFAIDFTHGSGDLTLEVTDKDGVVLGTGNSLTDNELVNLTGLSAGTYYMHIFGAENNYSLSVEPAGTSSTTVYYVNDLDLTNDVYTTAIGDDVNNGLTPATPKQTVQDVIDDYNLGSNDLIVIDTGTHSTNVVITAPDEGAAFAGSPFDSVFDASGSNFELIDADFNLLYGLRLEGSTGIYSHDDGVNPSTNNHFRNNTIVTGSNAIYLIDAQDDLIEDNIVSGVATYGMRIASSQNITLSGNTVSDKTYNFINTSSSNTVIDNNTISNGIYGVYNTSSSSSTQIINNTITGAATAGVQIVSTTSLTTVNGNDISFSGFGIDSNTSAINPIIDNDIHNNTTGIRVYSVVGPTDWAGGLENNIYNNTIGVYARNNSEIRFNHLYNNDRAIYIPEDNISVHHNVIYRNNNEGIMTNDGDNVDLVNNTIYAEAGKSINLTNFSSNVTLRNNIVWNTAGYDLYVDTDSQQGFASDYNNFFSSGTGKIVWWQKDFTDLFDWQVEAGFDPHSIGYTSVAPVLDNPQFVNLAGNDYHLTNAVSTSIDAGDPLDSLANEPIPAGDRVNLGAYGNTTEAALSQTAYIEIDYPNYYTDLPLTSPSIILWHSFGLGGNVDIDLYQDGVGKIDDIDIVPLADGSYSWQPDVDSGLTGSTTNRYYIRLTSIDVPAEMDDSRENFSVPPASANYYVDDNSNVNDEYTPGATGDNRNTGATASDPKANLLPILKNYDLGPGNTVNIDTGNYIHVSNVILSGGVSLGDDEGATFTGPTDPAKIARIDRANPYAGSTNIDITDGDFVTMANLTLVGGERGLWVHNGSTNFDGSNLVFENNTLDGLLIESDAEASTVDSLIAFDNGRDGIVILTPIDTLSNSEVYNNGRYGIYVTGIGSEISSNEVYGNSSYGIYAVGQTSQAPITVRDNIVYNNVQYGIYAANDAYVTRNVTYGHTVVNHAGVYVQTNTTAHENVSHNNYYGVLGQTTSSNIITNNTTYNNTVGISARNGTVMEGNKSYSNNVGIENLVWASFTGSISNNLVYDNVSHGIIVRSAAAGAKVNNNTVFEQSADAIHVQDGSDDLQVHNNILWATSASGHGLFIANDSQTGLGSDYNMFFTVDPVSLLDTGNVASWQGVSRKTLVDWQNASFLDNNSLLRDPLFVDPNGADGFYGYVSAVNDGRDDDFHLQSQYGRFTGGLTPFVNAGTGLAEMPVSVEINTDVVVSPGIDRGDDTFEFAVEPAPNGNFINIGAYGNTAQASKSPLEYTLVLRPDGGEVWPAGQTFEINWRSDTMDLDSIIPGLHSTYETEVLTESPVGYWKLDDAAGVAVDSSVNTNDGNYLNGVTQQVPGWLLGNDAAEFDGLNDLVQVPNDASLNPAAITVEAWIRPDSTTGLYDSPLMKTSSSNWTDGYGLYYNSGNIVFFVNNWSSVSVAAPVALDQWQHVVGTYSQADGNLRLYINGTELDTLAYANPIVHSAGSLHIGQGIGSTGYTWDGRLDEVAIYDAALTAGQVSDHYNAGLGTPTMVDIELIRDGDAGFNFQIANNTLNDGEFLWTIDGLDAPPNNDYRVRITRTDNVLLTDDSDNTFEVTAPINIYYVNDGTVIDGDDWTTAPGAPGNNGLTPATPKDSIEGVITQYDLQPGDIIRVDNGTYTVTSTIDVTNSDTGIIIEGYNDVSQPTRYAILDRDNTGQDVFDIQTDNVTLQHLHITGGRDGVRATNADNLTIENSFIYDNSRYGVHFDSSSSGGTVDSSEFDGNSSVQDYGIFGLGTNVTVTNSEFYGHRWDGIYISGDGGVVDTNVSYSNSRHGIHLTGSSAALVNNNDAYSNSSYGIFVHTNESLANVTLNETYNNLNVGLYISSNVFATNNISYGHTGSNDYGIFVSGGATADGNISHSNFDGIRGNSTSSNNILNNTVYNNSNYGVVAYNGSTISGNAIYSNNIGIQTLVWSTFTGSITNNLVYDNTTDGIKVHRTASGNEIANNTIYQSQGDALTIENISVDASIKNNILWVATDYALNVANDSQVGFSSDYNLFYLTGTGKLGLWEGLDFTNRVDWFYELGFDANSLTGDPLFVDIDGADNTLGYNAGNFGGDDDFHLTSSSPGIDNGNPADAYANELLPNGERVNIGFYGNTNEAANSPSELVQVLSPNGLEKLQHNQPITITWRTVGLPGTTLDIDLINASTLLVEQNIDTGVLDTGSYNWNVAPGIAAEQEYLIRITATMGTTPSDDSNEPFLITNDGNQYYINDAIVTDVNDWTTNPGDNAKSGKTADDPMASLTALLAAYDLEPGDTVSVDNGNYQIIKNIEVGVEDAGITIVGYNNGAFPLRKAVLDRANVNGTIFDIYADDVTMSYMNITGGQNGIRLYDADNFELNNSNVYNNSVYGVWVNSSSDQTTFNMNTFDGNGQFQDYGLFVQGPNSTITNNTLFDHWLDGVYVTGDNTNIDTNVAYGNRSEGIYVSNSSGALVNNNDSYNNTSYGIYVSGNNGEVQSTVTLNEVYNNSNHGLYVASNTIASNNVSYGQVGVNDYGIFVVGGAIVENNTAYNNYIGIIGNSTSSNTIRDNTVYNNTNQGIVAYNGSTITGNTIYSNSIGVQINVWATFTGSIEQNLVYGNSNEGVIVNRAASGSRIANNTIYQEVGDALKVQDSSSNITIRNNILWSTAGYALNVDSNSQVGFNSDYNLLYATGTAEIGRWQNTDITTLSDWAYASNADHNSAVGNPLFTDIDGADNILGYNVGNFGGDDDFTLQLTSPAIDLGDPVDPFANEPGPNGNRMNAGVFGNTVLAATSPAEQVQVLDPNGFEKFQEGQVMTINWLTSGLPGTTLDIDLVDANTLVVMANIATGEVDDGTASWVIPGSVPQELEYRVRITATTGTTPVDFSDNPFVISNNGNSYYINDGVVDGAGFDWTTAPGDDTNSGKLPSKPMTSLNALVDAYDLNAGDTVYVDNGNYTLLNTVILTLEDLGVTIEGYNSLSNPTGKAVMDRDNITRDIIEVLTNDVTISHLDITGGRDGIHGDDADNLSVLQNAISNNQRYGVHIQNDSSNPIINNNTVDGNAEVQDYGLYVLGVQPIVNENTVFDNRIDGIYINNNNADVQENESYNNGSRGIYVPGSGDAYIYGNTAYSNDSYGIYVTGSGGEPQVRVFNNESYNNNSHGYYISSNVLARDNVAHGQTGLNDYGIFVVGGAIADRNTVYNNDHGIVGNSTSSNFITNNIVYNNIQTGITAYNGSTITDNKVYSNSIGIRTLVWQTFTGAIENNLIYDNTNQGIIINRGALGATIANNTIYQEVGDALRQTDSSQSVEVRNNIFWVEAGYANYVDTNSMNNFDSDFNIYLIGNDPNAHLGFYNSTDYDNLGGIGVPGSWIDATLQDQTSLATDPLFVDPDGADNILGYTTAGSGYNGGADDNFLLAASSPAIDRADSFAAPILDIDDNVRVDDPGTVNAGSNDYVENNLGPIAFAAGGVAQNWRADNTHWNLALPFTFNFYGVDYNSVYVASNGFLQFGSNTNANDLSNTTAELLSHVRIAALWDDIRTNGHANDDVFVDTSIGTQVTIRWDATNVADSSDVNFSITLFDNNEIRFDYGSGNTNLTPTVGISAGDNSHYKIASHNTVPTLTDADSLEFVLEAGIADIGAYEFVGNSSDVTPPTIVSITPAEIPAGGLTNMPGQLLQIEFSEAINPIDATALANYDLRYYGPNMIFDDFDDVVFGLHNFIYVPGSTLVTVSVDGGPALVDGHYRLTIDGDNSIHDLAGLRLDGDEDTNEGGNYVRFFDVDVTDPTLSSWIITDDTGIPNDKITSDTTPVITLNFDEAIYGVNGDVTILDPTLTPVVPGSIAGWGTSTLTITMNALAVDGQYEITLDASAITDQAGNLLNGGTNEVLNFVLDQVKPQVIQVDINGGQVQRSNVSDITIQFNDDMNIPSLIVAGTIDDYIKLYDAFDLVTPLAWLDETRFSWDGGSDTLTIDLTIDGFGGSLLSNLPNGSYEIQIDTTQVQDLSGNDLVDDDGTLNNRLDIDRSTGAGFHDFYRMLADADGDRFVDMDDFTIWQTNYDPLGLGVNDPGVGDFNLDNLVDGADVAIWQQNYNASGLPSPLIAPGGGEEPEPDTIAPTVLAASINGGNAQRSTIHNLTVNFSEGVNVDASALTLYNETIGQAVDLSNASFVYNSQARIATWDLANVIVNDGIYSASLLSSNVTDGQGNQLDGDRDDAAGDDFDFMFHRLLADANGDGKVNRKDKKIWKKNYDPNGVNNNTVGMGDFNMDSRIDRDDYKIWKSNKGTKLSYPANIDELLLRL